jgi:hypothetical protein
VLTFGLDVANRAVTSFESVPLGGLGSAMGSAELVGSRSKHWLLQTGVVSAAVPFPKARLSAELRGVLPT